MNLTAEQKAAIQCAITTDVQAQRDDWDDLHVVIASIVDARLRPLRGLLFQLEQYAAAGRQEARSKHDGDPDRHYWEGCAEAHADDATDLRDALAEAGQA